jgi:Tfp pilus assembly protein PilN
MQAVNLLPAYARPGHPWGAVGKDLSPRRVLKAGSVVAFVAVLGLGFGYLHGRSVVNDKRAELADVQAEVAVADSKAAPLRATQAAAAARMAVAGTASSKRIAWEQLLADLSRVLPSHVYLLKLSMQSPTPLASGAAAPATTTPPAASTSAAGSPSAFTVTGVASSHVKVAVVLDRLASLPWLSNVTLLSSTNGASGTTLSRGDTFSVSAVLNPTGGAK